jgi:hypothetical protein
MRRALPTPIERAYSQRVSFIRGLSSLRPAECGALRVSAKKHRAFARVFTGDTVLVFVAV